MGIPVNYWAVLVSAIAAMVIGSLWYGPLFGKQWMALSGITKDKMEADKAKGKSMGASYALMALGSLVMAYVLHHSLVFASVYLNISGVNAGLQAAFWNWLGFIAPVSLGVVLWEGKSWKLWLINALYYLVTLGVMGVILASWM